MLRHFSFSCFGSVLRSNVLDEVESEYNAQLNKTEQKTNESLKLTSLKHCSPMENDSEIRDTISFMRETGLQPQNHHILSNNVTIVAVQRDKHGSMNPLNPPLSCTLREGVKLAKDSGLDLVRKSEILKNHGSREATLLCEIRDGVSDALLAANEKNKNENPRNCHDPYVVPFKGGTLDFHLRFKAKMAAKFLTKKRTVLVILTKFGTANEGFPVFSRFLSFVKLECPRNGKAGHKCGPISTSYDEIKMFLYPLVERHSVSNGLVIHPTAEELRNAKEERLRDAYEELKDPLYDSSYGLNAREKFKYEEDLDKGTAWAFQEDGPSLAKSRKMKIYNGWLPKQENEKCRSMIQRENIIFWRCHKTIYRALNLYER